jgi:HSP20 family protein
MSLIKWEPFGEMDRFFNEPFFSNFPSLTRPMGFDLAVDVYEEKDNVVAKMSLPGLKSEDVEVSIEDNTLTVTGRREEEKETKDKEYYSKEIRRGAFSRTVALPTSVKADKAEAKFADGMLTITVPVIEGAKEKAVKVKISK